MNANNAKTVQFTRNGYDVSEVARASFISGAPNRRDSNTVPEALAHIHELEAQRDALFTVLTAIENRLDISTLGCAGLAEGLHAIRARVANESVTGV